MQPTPCEIQKIQKDMAGPPRVSQEDTGHQHLATIVWPAIQVGGLSGISGLLVGGISGILKSSTPTLFALTSALQWFVLGSSFWAARGAILHPQADNSDQPINRVWASGLAGGVAGSLGGFLRGRMNVIPGAIIFSTLGALGQAAFNRGVWQSPAMSRSGLNHEFSWSKSKWSPMKVLSDEEYREMLGERLLRVNADIALVDERIEGLRKARDSPDGDTAPDI